MVGDKKAISEVLSMLLMVVIVVGLVGVLAFFVFGFARPIETKVEVRPLPCLYRNSVFGTQTFTNGAIRLEIVHIGTKEIPQNQISLINVYDLRTGSLVTVNFASRNIFNITEQIKPPNENLIPGETVYYVLNGTRVINPGDSFRVALSVAGQKYEVIVRC